MGRLFEILGDAHEDHLKAADWYAIGAETAPGWKNNWFKGVGASARYGVRFACEPALLATSDEEARKLIVDSENGFYSQHNADMHQYIRDRWEAGRQALTELWRDKAGCLSLLMSFGRNERRKKDGRRKHRASRRKRG